MIEADRLISAGAAREDEVIDRAIRPRKLADYTGQDHVCDQMEIFIEAARQRGEALDHLLIFGPPGLGKTTLANIVANEMGVSIKTTSGPVLEKAGDLAALLTNLEPNDVLFIDEIHRLSPVVEEVLYPAMEDYQLDIMIGEGPAARSIKLDLPPLHPDWSHHPGRLPDEPAAGSFRYRPAAGVLQRQGSHRHRLPQRPLSRARHVGGWCAGGCSPLPWNPADC